MGFCFVDDAHAAQAYSSTVSSSFDEVGNTPSAKNLRDSGGRYWVMLVMGKHGENWGNKQLFHFFWSWMVLVYSVIFCFSFATSCWPGNSILESRWVGFQIEAPKHAIQVKCLVRAIFRIRSWNTGSLNMKLELGCSITILISGRKVRTKCKKQTLGSANWTIVS